jgi:hypothetical protein
MSPPRPLLLRIEPRLFALLVAVMVLPAWLVEHFPSQDGPIHLYILHVWQHYDLPGFGAFRRHFELNRSLEPNLGFYLLAYPLLLLFDPATVEKLFVSLVAVVFCYGGRWTLRRINPEAALLALLLVPLSWHYFIHLGFYSFSLGVALLLPAFGLVQAPLRRLRPLDLALIGLVALVLVVVHLMAFVLFALAIALYLLGRIAAALAVGRAGYRLLPALVLRSLGAGVALLPALVVMRGFLARHGVSGTAPVPSFLRELRQLLAVSAQVSFDAVELAWIAPIALLLVVLAIAAALAQWRDGSWRRFLPLALVPLGLVVVYFLPALTTKNVQVSERVQLVIPIMLLFWLACVAPGPRLARATVAVAVVAVLASSSYRLWQYGRIALGLQEHQALASLIAPGATILPLRYDRSRISVLGENVSLRSDPLLHASALVASARDGIYLSASLMSRLRYGYFPVLFREEMDPFRHLGLEIEAIPPIADLEAYARATGRPVDHLLIWSPDRMDERDPARVRAVMSQIEADYTRPSASPRGFVFAYRHCAPCEEEDEVVVTSHSAASPHAGPHP